jgi:hypothetical protein
MSDPPFAPRPLPSLVTGGPFHALMRRAGMLAADDLPSARAAWLVGAIAWLVGALLAMLQSWTAADPDLLAYFLDASPAAHALVALPVMIGIERSANGQLLSLLEHPLGHGLVPPSHEAAWREAVARADRRSGSALAEGFILLVAVAVCLALAAYTEMLGVDRWSRAGGRAGGPLSWAGAWTHVVVGALFVFLVLRWLLRFLVWSLLLWKLARMPLRLVASHPDRAAGLGFLAGYPTLFLGLVLGVGTAIGAKMLNSTVNGNATPEDLAAALAVWVAVVLVVFVGPVLFYAPRLAAFRNESLIEFGALGVRANRGLLEAIRESSASGDLERTARDESSRNALNALNALNNLHDRVDSIQPLLVTRATLIQLAVFALLPMLPALAVHVPLSRLLDLLLGGFT